MENTVYVAHAHYFDGHTVIIGVYSDRNKANQACDDWENEFSDCNWTDYAPYEIDNNQLSC